MMHSLFGEWYRKASIEPTSEQLTARWKAIEAFVKRIDSTKILELVRCFVLLPSKNGAVLSEFVAAFQAIDAAFPIRGNDVELQVLAGAALIAVLEPKSVQSDFAASVLEAASAIGLRPAPVIPEILLLAEKYNFDRSAVVREVTRKTIGGYEHAQLIEAAKAACTANQVLDLGPPLGQALGGLNDSMKKMAIAVEGALAAVDRAQAVQAEESNIVWWVFGETSKDLRERFSSLSKGRAAIVAGKELADLTNIIPGPRAARAYLDRVLGHSDSKKVTLADVAREPANEWLRSFTFDESVLDLFPVLYTLHEIAEGRKPQDARAGTRKQPSVFNSGLSPLELALQTYKECLAVKISLRK